MSNILFLPAIVFLLVITATILFEKWLIPTLSSRASQPIYKDGPSWHLSKQGTPTMGGLAFLFSISIVLAATSVYLINTENKSTGISIIISLVFCLANGLIGVIDDFTKLKRKENAGLTPAQKLIFQLIIAILFLMARKHLLNDTTIIEFPFFRIDIGVLYYPLAIILLLGIINCANLTDGIDGLASSVALTIGAVFLFIGSCDESSVMSAALIGGALGFLLFNAHPAKIFMGDTGSLFLGAMSVSLAFSNGNPLIIIFLGGIYVIEGLSVIIQVAFFKATGKRIFKMAPLHHHLEKCGIGESRICVIAVFVTLVLSAFAILLLEK